jgi:hypothetical protein
MRRRSNGERARERISTRSRRSGATKGRGKAPERRKRKTHASNVNARGSLFEQLTVGCHRRNCANSKCASCVENTPLPPTEAAVTSVLLAAQAEARGYLCSDDNVFDCSSARDMLAIVDAALAVSHSLTREQFADSPAHRALVRRIGAVFARWQSLALSFHLADQPAQLDLLAVERFFTAVRQMPRPSDVLDGAVSRLIDAVGVEGRLVKSPAIARVFAILMAQPDAQREGAALSKVCSAARRLSDAARDALRVAWSAEAATVLQQRLQLLRNTLALDAAATQQSLHQHAAARGATTLMRVLYEINSARQQQALAAVALPPDPFASARAPPATAAATAAASSDDASTSDVHRFDDSAVASVPAPAADKAPFAEFGDFQVELVGEKIDLVQDYSLWRDGSSGGGDGFSFIGHSFVLDTALKAKVLHVQSIVAQREQQTNAMREALMSGQRRFSPYLGIRVRRDHIVEDSLDALQAAPAADLRKPLRVSFEGEEGIDEGGVRKEWFQLLVKEIFDVKYGMFHFDTATRAHWFRRDSDERLFFNLMGTLLGMAIYNGVILDLHFPSVVYKLLLGVPVQFDDLAQVDQALHAGLQQMLTFDGDVADVYERTFEAEFAVYGAPVTAPLVPGGEKVTLTNANRRQYVRYYARHVLIDSVRDQWAAFQRGFNLVMGGIATSGMFAWQELKELICGSDVIDMHELERGTRYDANYSADHPSVRLFWKVVHSLTPDEQRRLLRFATGSDRAPIGGLQNLNLIIVFQPDSDRVPSAHTCFNHLVLPAYTTEEKMHRMIHVALSNDSGFGLL